MSRMKEEYEREILIIDRSDGSGDVLARSSAATLADDLVFLFGADPAESPQVLDACLAISDAYAGDGDVSEPASLLGIELRRA